MRHLFLLENRSYISRHWACTEKVLEKVSATPFYEGGLLYLRGVGLPALTTQRPGKGNDDQWSRHNELHGRGQMDCTPLG